MRNAACGGRKRMSIPERIGLVEESWEGIAAAPEAAPVTTAQREELIRRVGAYRQDSQEGASWEQVRARMTRG